MNGKPYLVVSAEGLPRLSLEAWAEATLARVEAGARLVSMFGRPDQAGVVVTSVLEGDGLVVIRGVGGAGASYPALTPRHSPAQHFEREIWEQTGLVPAGHPWLKPIRYQGARQREMSSYPFYRLEGKEVHEVGVGPVHAGVIEPGHFRFMCFGEKVHHLEIQLGYQHRGVEALLKEKPLRALAPLVETIAGDSSVAQAWAHAQAVEALLGQSLDPDTALVRGIALELERIAMHLASLAGLATDIAFLQGASSYGRIRTAAINASMRVCGSRFGRSWIRPGGVRFPITSARAEDLAKTLAAMADDLYDVDALMLEAQTVRARFAGVGAVDAETARAIGMVGMAARASGRLLDLRTNLPGAPYTSRAIPMVVEPSGDCWARMRVRQREIGASIAWIRAALAEARPLGAPLPAPAPLPPHALAISLIEAHRGELMHAIETGAEGEIIHYKVQDPSLKNWFGLALALRHNEISDFPICNKSFDLSYAGNDL
ncbi:MAG: hydrogenase [Myxococcota bacterium]